MKKNNTTEKEILDSFEQDEWRSVRNFGSVKSRYEKIARATILKKKRINVDVTEKDMLHLKAKSLEEGIPFEVFIMSILHKYATGKLAEN